MPTSFEYVLGEDERYLVDFNRGGEIPTTLYHFDRLDEIPEIDLSQEDEYYFREKMVDKAKAFVKKLYMVDCSNAGVHACGYGVKIAVTLDVTPD